MEGSWARGPRSIAVFVCLRQVAGRRRWKCWTPHAVLRAAFKDLAVAARVLSRFYNACHKTVTDARCTVAGFVVTKQEGWDKRWCSTRAERLSHVFPCSNLLAKFEVPCRTLSSCLVVDVSGLRCLRGMVWHVRYGVLRIAVLPICLRLL